MGLFDSKEKKLFDEKLKQIFSVGEEFKIDICNIFYELWFVLLVWEEERRTKFCE